MPILDNGYSASLTNCNQGAEVSGDKIPGEQDHAAISHLHDQKTVVKSVSTSIFKPICQSVKS